MDLSQSNYRIEKLSTNNFHAWKTRIQFILALKDADQYLEEAIPLKSSDKYSSWIRGDIKARALIALTLSDDHLEQVQHASTTREMWSLLCDIYEKHTLLNKLAARRRFYTARMNDNEKILQFSSRIRKLASTLKSMSVTIDSSEMAMAFLNGLPDRFDSLISALDTLDTDDDTFTLEFVLSRCLQEEQRQNLRAEESLLQSDAAALLAKHHAGRIISRSAQGQQDLCIHCGKHTNSDRCYRKFPHLAPPGHPARNPSRLAPAFSPRHQPRRRHPTALFARDPLPATTQNIRSDPVPAVSEEPETDDENFVCLFSNPVEAPITTTTLENAFTYPSPNSSHFLETALFSSFSSKAWIIDSGCTSHVTFDRSSFSSYETISPKSLDLGAKSSAPIVGRGCVTLTVMVKGKSLTCQLDNVLHVPDLRYQLISVSRIVKKGITATFTADSVSFLHTSSARLVATGTMQNGLYTLDLGIPQLPTPSDQKALAVDLNVWHERLAHVNFSTIKQMANTGAVNDLHIGSFAQPGHCKGCTVAKAHRTAIPKISETRSTYPLELVHTDVLGPIEVPSLGGARYVITFIDDFTKWITHYPMKHKSQALQCFKHFKTHAEKHVMQPLAKTKHKQSNDNPLSFCNRPEVYPSLQQLRSDNGGEYLSAEFKNFLSEHGIKHQLTVPYTPQQNGIAERMNRTLLNLVRSMLHHKNIPTHFWAEAFSTAVYIRNRVLSRSVPQNSTPFQLWYGRKPSLKHLRSFGTKCWYTIPRHKIKKLDARARCALMMGYSSQTKGYKLWDIELQKFLISRDVKFLETSFNEIQPVPLKHDKNPTHACIPISSPSDEHQCLTFERNDPIIPPTSPPHTHPEIPGLTTTGLRRSTRIARPPRRWGFESPEDPLPVSLFAEIALIVNTAPRSYADAMSSENSAYWSPAIKKEEDSLRENKTFQLVERTPEMHVIPSRYVFRVKKDVGPKVRIVAKGFRQIPGLEYTDTYSPVVSFSVVRLFLALVAHHDLECYQMDVVTAFLNGDLSEEIYMTVPDGFRDPDRPNLVCKLMKALYGLKQAPKQWNSKIHLFLTHDLGFESCAYEPCLYFIHDEVSLILIILYVDDLLIAGNSDIKLQSIKAQLMTRFKMKDLGPVSEFLGIEVIRDRATHSLKIFQSSYTSKILERFNMLGATSAATPMATQGKPDLTTESQTTLSPDIPYRSAIGSLMYLMVCTRPDISFALGRLAQFAENPLQCHWIAVKRIFRYLKGTTSLGITYERVSGLELTGYCDSDWAGCRDSRKSTEGYAFLFANAAISWRSKKQSIIALSSCEAEYISCTSASKEAIWISNILSSLNQVPPSPVPLYIDNQGCIESSKNVSINARNKHIDIRHHFIRDAVASKRIAPQHCPTADQTADIFTKALARVLFTRFCSKLGLK